VTSPEDLAPGQAANGATHSGSHLHAIGVADSESSRENTWVEQFSSLSRLERIFDSQPRTCERRLTATIRSMELKCKLRDTNRRMTSRQLFSLQAICSYSHRHVSAFTYLEP
jgi:hypothetical protein